jgi:hypothetical protein
LLAFEILLFKTRMRNEVSEQVDGLRKRRIRDLNGEPCHFVSRVSIEVAAKPVAFNCDIASGAVGCPFEDRVLDEVANSVEFGRLVPRSPSDPDTGRHRPQTRHVFGQDCDPIWEFCRLNLVYHAFGDQKLGVFARGRTGSVES